jgi:RND family efflux transporter MFP subunit
VSSSAYDQSKAAADAAQAQLNAAEAQARVSRNSANYSVLVADADGVVMQTSAEPGQVVGAGQTVVRLARSGPREATVSLPETVRPALGSSAQAELYGASASGGAVLRQLSGFADPVTRTFEARYVLTGAAAAAPLGSTVTVSLPDARPSSGQQIPLSALFDRGQGPGVWVIDPRTSTVNWRPVVIGSLSDEAATLVGGLNAGDRFVALGAHLIHQGQKVRVLAGGAAQ